MTERRFAAHCAILALLALLAGCSLVPAYERPVPPIPERFPGNDRQPAAALPGWRDYYDEPELQTLIAASLAHNRDLRIAIARVEEARGLAGIARADRLPTVNVQGSGNRARTPADLTNLGQARTSSRYDLGLGITAFELDFWGRVAALDEAARAQYLASEEAARAFRVSLIGDVATTWYLLAELTERELLAAETLTNRSDSLALLRKRQEVGLVSGLEVLAAEGLVESVRAQLSEIRRQRLLTENALSLLTGMSATLPRPAFISRKGAPTTLVPGLPSEVLFARPDVRAAEQRLIAANANVGAARAAFFPSITLTGSLGTASAALSGLFDAGSGIWLFQPVLKFPLFDAGRAQANLDVAEARKIAAVADYEKTVQQAFREVADALATRETYAEQVAALEANLAVQQARLDRVQARQRAGVASYLEVLDASRDAFAAQQSLVTARRQLLAAAATLYKALGGGSED
jgi:multidrug efflux system outer membrane protein